MRGRATCATRDALEAIYAAKQQKGKRAEIEKILTEVVIFVKHIRGRIEQYVAFGHKMLAYLDRRRRPIRRRPISWPRWKPPPGHRRGVRPAESDDQDPAVRG